MATRQGLTGGLALVPAVAGCADVGEGDLGTDIAAASIGSLEAEAMPPASTSFGFSVRSDAAANGGRAAVLYGRGSIRGSFTTSADATQVTVRARGDQCSGGPQMVVRVDGAQVLSTAVTATSWTTYSAPAAIPAGRHTVSVDFTNDYYPSSTCDRNLWVDVLSFSNTAPAAGAGTGLRGEYFDNMDFTAPRTTRVDPTVNFAWGSGAPATDVGADTFSARWTGQVEAEYTETYTFYTLSDDGVRLWVDGRLLIDNWTDHARTENSATIALTAGRRYDIRLEFYENRGDAVIGLHWSSPRTPKQVIPRARLYPASATTTPPPPPPPPDGTPTPLGVSGTWRFLWGDEFSGSALDSTKWRTHEPWNSAPGFAMNSKTYCPVPAGDLVAVEGGSLVLRGGRRANPLGREISSCFVTSRSRPCTCGSTCRPASGPRTPRSPPRRATCGWTTSASGRVELCVTNRCRRSTPGARARARPLWAPARFAGAVARGSPAPHPRPATRTDPPAGALALLAALLAPTGCRRSHAEATNLAQQIRFRQNRRYANLA